jgi:2-amino-4-hydroxy-6-hydroxymethyldihydropteridine diphosphokinase
VAALSPSQATALVHHETPPCRPARLLNGLEAETDLELSRADRLPEKLETELGRENLPQRSRLIDMDILFYDDLVFDKSDLVIPHPRTSRTRLCARPLNDIAPDLIHPVLKRTVRDLLKSGHERSESPWTP